MLKLYVKSNCLGSQKAENFLKKNDLKYERINLSFVPLNEEDLFAMQSLAKPIQEIINFNSSIFEGNEELKQKILTANSKEAITFIFNNVDCLSYPFIVESSDKGKVKTILIGFNDGEWKILMDEAYNDSLNTSYSNISKSFIFKTCCFYDEVANDDTNILVNLEKNKI